jgi:hypothetical protein
LPAEAQFLVSCAFKLDEQSQPILPLGEVRTAAYDKQQTHLRLIIVIVDHGIWPMNFNDNKNRLKKSSNNITI